MGEFWFLVMLMIIFILYIDYKILKNQELWDEYKKEVSYRYKAIMIVVRIFKQMKKGIK